LDPSTAEGECRSRLLLSFDHVKFRSCRSSGKNNATVFRGLTHPGNILSAHRALRKASGGCRIYQGQTSGRHELPRGRWRHSLALG